MKEIGIIGGGASGVALVYHLAVALRAANIGGVTVTVFERSGVFGRGLAYSSQSRSSILNMRNSTMSILRDEPQHFVKWIDRTGRASTLQPDELEYAPRSVFGDYLEDYLVEAGAILKDSNSTLRLISSEIRDIHRDGESIVLNPSSGNAVRCDYVALALGHLPGSDYQGLLGAQGYYSSPYPELAYTAALSTARSIGILGSRLSAIDAVLALSSSGYRGEIHIFSRSGVLPGVQARLQSKTANTLTPIANLCELSTLIEEEWCQDTSLRNSYRDFRLGKLDGVCKFHQDFADANTGTPISRVLLGASTDLWTVWQSLSVRDRERITSRYLSFWRTVRHPMPYVNAKKIAALLKSGQLHLHSRLKSVVSTTGQQGEFLVRTGTSQWRCQGIINAIGASADLSLVPSRGLLHHAIRRGMLVPHRAGGVTMNILTGAAIDLSRQESRNLYVIGPLTTGEAFYTNAMEISAKQAQIIASQIALQLRCLRRKRWAHVAKRGVACAA